MSSRKPLKRLFFRWTALKGLTAIVLFFVLALSIEYIVVHLFLSAGLTDEFLISQIFRLPGTIFSFTVTISPIFHLIPLGVIIVQISSWAYILKHIAVAPRKLSAPRKAQQVHRKRGVGARKVRFRWFRQLSKKIRRRLRRVGGRMSAAFRRIPGVAFVLQRLSFAKATIKGGAIVVAIFLTSIFAVSMLSYPSLIHDRIIGLYGANPGFHGFVLRTIEIARAIGEALTPVGWVLSGIDNTLHSVAPSFRSSILGFGTLISEPFSKLDSVWKYVVIQNVAAWFSSVMALIYGQHISRSHRRYRRR